MISKRYVSTNRREELAGKKKAMPGGRYPIENVGDLKNAIQACGRTPEHGRPAVKNWIKRRAKELGREDLIPEDWKRRNRLSKLNTRAPLDRSPKKNWVENRGGLPMYIRRIANHLHAEKGMTISRAIATAINAAKKMCASGDLNFKGTQNVNAASRAEACGAIRRWEAMKGAARVSKGITGRKLSDEEMIQHLIEKRGSEEALMMRVPRELVISDEEFEELQKFVSGGMDDPDDPDTWEFHAQYEISKTDDEKMLAFGWASIGTDAEGNVVDDKQGDVLDNPEEIEKAAYDFVLESRDGGEMHVRKGVGTLVESFVSTPEKWDAMGIPAGTLPVGWWVGFKVHDQNLWNGVKSGKYRMFSVHGRGTREALDD